MWTALTASGTGRHLLSAEAPFYTNVCEGSGTGRPTEFAIGSGRSGGPIYSMALGLGTRFLMLIPAPTLLVRFVPGTPDSKPL